MQRCDPGEQNRSGTEAHLGAREGELLGTVGNHGRGAYGKAGNLGNSIVERIRLYRRHQKNGSRSKEGANTRRQDDGNFMIRCDLRSVGLLSLSSLILNSNAALWCHLLWYAVQGRCVCVCVCVHIYVHVCMPAQQTFSWRIVLK